YLTSNWTAAEQIVDLDRVRIPIGAGSGTYHWRVTLANQAPVDLGELRVTAPTRSFFRPPIAPPIDQTFDKKITLLGYNTEGSIAAGQPITVTLYWRAEVEMDTTYKVFVQLIDANQQPHVQADAIPVNGSRPTTGWQPGEILTDTYTLNLPADLPAGQYRLVTGLYDPNDLARLQLPNGDDHVELK
ncbi:MAG TPA: hypothetical protein VFK30_14330, partial [Anaerolineae bacterium]|nr:hypothetical protein [Anaerolineae bacterium]